MSAHRRPDTPVAVARNLAREGETCRIIRLDQLAAAQVDMKKGTRDE